MPQHQVGGHRRAVGLLALSNVLGGVGVASGVTVGALLAEQVGGRRGAAESVGTPAERR